MTTLEVATPNEGKFESFYVLFLYYVPLEPHFYKAKTASSGVIVVFLSLLGHLECWCSLESPQRDVSSAFQQSVSWAGTGWKQKHFLQP